MGAGGRVCGRGLNGFLGWLGRLGRMVLVGWDALVG